jgi:hypothetical protein
MRTSLYVTVAACAALVAGTARAQSDNSGSAADLARMPRVLEARQRQDRIAALEADRSAMVAEIVERFAPSLADGGAELQRALAKVPAAVVLNAAEAKSLAEVGGALFGQGASGVGPADLGSANSDLVFFPVTPCRLVDTRLAGGALLPGAPRSFDANGANLSSQGGSATGCGVPDPDPAALAVTITAVAAQGPGNFRAYPSGAAAPTASVINYALPGQGLNLANTTILPIQQSLAAINEFTVQADASGAQLVIDVVGYFFSPNSTAPACTTLSTESEETASFNIQSPACPAGSVLTGGGFDWHQGNTDVWIWQSAPNLFNTTWQVRGNVNRGGAASDITAFAICCRIPGR